jgi:alpha-tubulin suppressor-like RCC1 family protein
MSGRIIATLLQQEFAAASLRVGLGLALLVLMQTAYDARASSAVITWGNPGGQESIVPAGLSNVTAVAAGTSSSLALKDDGTLIFWGNSYWGTSSSNFPPGLTNISAIALGYAHALALRGDGRVLAWGAGMLNATGQLDRAQSVVPTDMTNATAIAAGADFSLALRSNGTVVVWGALTNVPPSLTNVTAIAAGSSHGLALKANGTVAVWRNHDLYNPAITNVPAGLSNVIAIAADGSFSLALRADGTVTGWGNNSYGEANIPPGLSNVTKIACGEFHSLALKADGTLVCWGAGGSGSNSWPHTGQSILPFGLTNVSTMSGGYFHSVAINNGSPVLTGVPVSKTNYSGDTIILGGGAAGLPPFNYQWQFYGTNLTDATNLTLVVTNLQLASAGNYRLIVSNPYGSVTSPDAILVVSNSRPLIVQQPVSLARLITSNHTFSVAVTGSIPVSCQWRFNGENIPGGSETALSLTNLQLDASGVYDCILANNYGSVTSAPALLTVTPTYVVGWGQGYQGETNHPFTLSNAVAIAAGSGGLALQSNGFVVAWGPGTGLTNIPTGLSNVIAIAAGTMNVALTAEGRVVCWGANSFSQTNVPAGLSNVVAIAAGDYHGMALRRDGTIAGWGSWVIDQINLGAFTVPAAATNIIAISTGSDHALALRRNGTVLGWRNHSISNSAAALNGVVAIASGDQHCLALKSNGTVVAWGNSASGATIVPAGLSNIVAIAAGSGHSVALKADGTIVAWGYNPYRPMTAPTGLRNVVAIAAGDYHTLALRDLRAASPNPVMPSKSNNIFTAVTPTLNHHTYSLEGRDSLVQTNWQFLGVIGGIGDPATLNDPGASGPQRFYRIRQW